MKVFLSWLVTLLFFRLGGLPDTEQVKGMVSSLWLLGVCLGSYIGATIGSAVFDHFSFEESTFFECCLMGLNVSYTFYLGFPFANLLRNFCGTKRKIFLSLRISFARKNNNFCNHSQKSFRAKLPYSAFAKLKFCAIPQFRKNQMVGDGVCFLEFDSGKILFWNRKLVTFT